MSIDIDIDHRFNEFELKLQLQLPASGVSALFGASGCGKTSCLRIIAGLDHYPNVRIQVNNEIWQDQNNFVASHKRNIGFVFQEPRLFKHLNVRDNILFGWKRLRPEQRFTELQSVLDILGIEPLLTRKISALSGGEQQRIAIARALMVSPKLLLMDEPLSALDLERKQEILPYLERLHAQLSIPIIYVSHSPDEVSRLADTLVVLEQGQVKAQGTLKDVLADNHSMYSFSDGLSSIFEGQLGVASSDGLSFFSVEGFGFWLSHNSVNNAMNARCRIFASDVSISLEQPQQSSIINCLAARITKISAGRNPAHCIVHLDLGKQHYLLAQISERSRNALALKQGQCVWAQIKSVAIL